MATFAKTDKIIDTMRIHAAMLTKGPRLSSVIVANRGGGGVSIVQAAKPTTDFDFDNAQQNRLLDIRKCVARAQDEGRSKGDKRKTRA